MRPIHDLSREWLSHADEASAEFRLARAMASILRESKDGKIAVGPIRWNLESVGMPQGRLEWAKDSTSYVWTAGDPLDNMLAVLERRCLEGRMKGLSHGPRLHIFSPSK